MSATDKGGPKNLWGLMSLFRPLFGPHKTLPSGAPLPKQRNISVDDFIWVKKISSGAFGYVFVYLAYL